MWVHLLDFYWISFVVSSSQSTKTVKKKKKKKKNRKKKKNVKMKRKRKEIKGSPIDDRYWPNQRKNNGLKMRNNQKLIN